MPDTAILGLIVGPLVGLLALIGVIWQALVNRRNNKDQVSVSRQEAETHEFEVITAGFVKQIEEVRKFANERIEGLERRVAHLEGERAAMLTHIGQLELMIPNPPGPPARPPWGLYQP